MKLRAVEMDDEEMPASLTVEMTVDEAALLYALTGKVAPKVVAEAIGLDFGNALYDVASCLSGSFFNRWWDNGARDVVNLDRLRVVDTTAEVVADRG